MPVSLLPLCSSISLVVNSVFPDHQMPRSLRLFLPSLECYLHRGFHWVLCQRQLPPLLLILHPLTLFLLLFITTWYFTWYNLRWFFCLSLPQEFTFNGSRDLISLLCLTWVNITGTQKIFALCMGEWIDGWWIHLSVYSKSETNETKL